MKRHASEKRSETQFIQLEALLAVASILVSKELPAAKETHNISIGLQHPSSFPSRTRHRQPFLF
jgi:cell division protein ZapA (FtsZ GTPase activity inhibitor)